MRSQSYAFLESLSPRTSAVKFADWVNPFAIFRNRTRLERKAQKTYSTKVPNSDSPRPTVKAYDNIQQLLKFKPVEATMLHISHHFEGICLKITAPILLHGFLSFSFQIFFFYKYIGNFQYSSGSICMVKTI